MTIRSFGLHVVVLASVALAAGPQAAGGELWYSAQEGWGADSHLYSYNLGTGTVTDRGATTGLGLVTDVAMDDTGNLYGIGFGNAYGSGSGKLYALTAGSNTNPATYTELTINGTLSGSINGLAWRDGTLYVSSADKKFYGLTAEIDGSWTVAASDKMNHASSGDLAFGDDGTLFASVSSGNEARIAAVNYDMSSRHFGQDTYLKKGGKTGYDSVFGLAFVDGTLYGAAANSQFGNSVLVSLDQTTGDATFVADLGTSVWGMTASTYSWDGVSGQAVPEPASTALFVLGMAGLVTYRSRQRRSEVTPEV